MDHDKSRPARLNAKLIICFPLYLMTFAITGLTTLINGSLFPDFFRGVGMAACLTVLIVVLDTLWMRLLFGNWDG